MSDVTTSLYITRELFILCEKKKNVSMFQTLQFYKLEMQVNVYFFLNEIIYFLMHYSKYSL